MNGFVELVNRQDLGCLRENVSFKQITSLKMGGIVKYLYEPNTVDNLITAYQYLKANKIPSYVIGNGTNLLVSDETFDMVLIRLSRLSYFKDLGDGKFMIEAGAKSMPAGRRIAKLGYSGSSFMGVIPGTIGGLIYMNGGAFKRDTSMYIYQCDYLDSEGNLIEKTSDFGFAYRKSIFQEIDGLILRGYFKFPKADDLEEPYKTIFRYHEIKHNTQPLGERNAGSVFRNPSNINAWEIVDGLGYRGFRIGDAAVSMKHANFLVNKGNATFDDMYQLVTMIQGDAKKHYGIDLLCEWRILKK